MSSERYVCIHGHFYQPPRENAWLEAIEQQESAWPCHDWNERVSRECYGPNAHARVIGGAGKIVDIANNYSRINFNFGPTLLSWLESEDRDVYGAILRADRESQALFDGHGSAMAQVYNHAILPLCNARDQQTQVRWGVADFRARFGRAPEGMWLAETAVDTQSLEVLAAHGIAFTVLAPHQCIEVRPPGGAWHDVRGQKVDPRRPYRVPLPSGASIDVFFYDGPVSRAVAFEHLLDDGHRFAARLLGALDPNRGEPQLVHIATDGETYGHHHRYGEMALASALREIEADPDVSLINYGAFLAKHPPVWEARIAERTAWSCAHGIERWRSDCGCNGGTGWHQRWRRPLRDALDWLRDELAPAFEEAGAELFFDPWEARDGYIDVVLDRSGASLERFFDRYAKGGAPNRADRQRALSLLEMQRHAMLMYTSCGWFFDEISGIEAVQVLQYAARASQLATELFGDRFEPGFRERLARAPSNRPEFGDGDRVFEARVEPSRVDLPSVGAHFALGSVFEDSPSAPEVGGFVGELVEHQLLRTGRSTLSVGSLEVRSRITTERERFSFAVLHLGDHNLLGGIRPFGGAPAHVGMHGGLSHAFSRADLTEVVRQIERHFERRTFSLRSLFRDEQRRILGRLLERRTRSVEETYEGIYEQVAPLMRFLESLEQPAPPVFRAAAEYTLTARLRRELERGRELDVERVSRLVEDAREASVALDGATLGVALEASFESLLRELRADPEELDLLRHVERVAALVASSPWPMDLSEAQNQAWQLLREVLPAWKSRSILDDPRVAERREALASVAATLELVPPR